MKSRFSQSPRGFHSNRLYHTLKPSQVDFSMDRISNQLQTYPMKQTPNNQPTKVSQLKTKQKLLQNKIELLQEMNKNLSEQLKKQQQFNRKLLGDKMSIQNTDMHYLVQDLMITDARNLLNSAQNSVQYYREELEKMRHKYQGALNQNKKLQGIVKRYRKAMNSSLKEHKQEVISFDSQTSQIDRSVLSNIQRTQWKPLVVKLSQIAAELSKSKNLVQILNTVTAGCKTLVGSSECSVYLLSERVYQDYFKYFQSAHEVHKIIVGTSWVYMHTDPSSDLTQPIFSKIEEAKQTYSRSHLVQPIQVNTQKQIVVQCVSSQKSFTFNDQVILKLFTEIIKQALMFYFSMLNQKKLEVHIEKISSIAQELALCRNHCQFSNTIDSLLPDFSDFEGASILFVDEDAQEFYANALSSSGDLRYGPHMVRYPSSLGVSSDLLKFRKTIVFKDIKRRPMYNPEVDNLAGLQGLKDAIMGCLFNPSGKIVGIIQLGNKNKGSIDQKDIKLIEQINLILGSFITGINDTVEAMELTIRMKKTIETLVEITSSDFDAGFDMSEVSEAVHLMKNMMIRWSYEKRQRGSD